MGRTTGFFVKIRTYFTLKSAMHGMTLNTIGNLYGVRRVKGECNRHYERRILKTATVKPPNVAAKAKEVTE